MVLLRSKAICRVPLLLSDLHHPKFKTSSKDEERGAILSLESFEENTIRLLISPPGSIIGYQGNPTEEI
jgi:hypothetical protein